MNDSQPTGHRYERGCPERAIAVGFRLHTELSGREMSSSIEGESFKIGAHVEATDGRCGHLTRVIIDPVADVTASSANMALATLTFRSTA